MRMRLMIATVIVGPTVSACTATHHAAEPIPSSSHVRSGSPPPTSQPQVSVPASGHVLGRRVLTGLISGPPAP
jgi:hypothetical protein